MKGTRYSQAQIIAALKEHEAGAKVADVCRKLGVVENTFYRWKSQYGGMEVSEAVRLKALELENSKLKRMVADLMLENSAIKEVLGKKW
jgi:putative transposase